jgi:hypothetical protein
MKGEVASGEDLHNLKPDNSGKCGQADEATERKIRIFMKKS